jgi:hypothetical protein
MTGEEILEAFSVRTPDSLTKTCQLPTGHLLARLGRCQTFLHSSRRKLAYLALVPRIHGCFCYGIVLQDELLLAAYFDTWCMDWMLRIWDLRSWAL